MECYPKRKCLTKPPKCIIKPKCKITYNPQIPSIKSIITNPYIKQFNKKGPPQSNMYSNKMNKYLPSNNNYYKCNSNIDVYHLSNKCKLPKNKKFPTAHAMPTRLSFTSHFPWSRS